MAVRISCTHCNSGLSMPESMYGKPVRCPKCQKIFECPPGPEGTTEAPVKREPRKRPATMPDGGNPFAFEEASAPPARGGDADLEELPTDDDVAVTRSRHRKQGWDRACQGVIFLCISAGLYLGFYLVLHFILGSSSPPKPDLAKVIIILQVLLFVGACAVGTLGLMRFAAVPPASGARGAANAGMFALLLCTLTGFLYGTMLLIVMFGEKPPGEGMAKAMGWLMLATVTLMVAAFSLCIFFLTIAAVHLQTQAMLGSVVAHGVYLMVSPFALIAFLMFVSLGGPGPRGGGGPGFSLTGTFNLILILGAVVWFIVNVLTLNAAVARARRKGLI